MNRSFGYSGVVKTLLATRRRHAHTLEQLQKNANLVPNTSFREKERKNELQRYTKNYPKRLGVPKKAPSPRIFTRRTVFPNPLRSVPGLPVLPPHSFFCHAARWCHSHAGR
jgi:hypothetical protein